MSPSSTKDDVSNHCRTVLHSNKLPFHNIRLLQLAPDVPFCDTPVTRQGQVIGCGIHTRTHHTPAVPPQVVGAVAGGVTQPRRSFVQCLSGHQPARRLGPQPQILVSVRQQFFRYLQASHHCICQLLVVLAASDATGERRVKLLVDQRVAVLQQLTDPVTAAQHFVRDGRHSIDACSLMQRTHLPAMRRHQFQSRL